MMNLNKHFPATLALASAVSLATAEMAIAQESTDSADDFLAIEEIIVTAQRRSQSIQDVANSVEAITGDVLDELGKVGLDDYISSVGGAGYTKTGSGSVKIGLRGVSPLAQNQFAFAGTVSTVGMYLDDVAVQGAGSLPDLNLYDLQRVEVLKGPQGTLYGDGAMGGAIKMILNKPDLSDFEAKGEVTALDTEGASLGHRVRGAVNLPIIEDKLALRLVGSTSESKGWIDNIATGKNGVNDSDSWSLRASALAQITENFSAELLVMHDEQDNDGSSRVDLGLNKYEAKFQENEFNETEVDLYALTLKYDLGFAELTSITSLFEKERTMSTRQYLGAAELLTFEFFDPQAYYQGFIDNATLSAHDEEETFSQEIRLVSTGDNALDWTAGIFYRERERDICSSADSPANADLNADPNTYALLGFQTISDVYGSLPASTFNCEADLPSGLDSANRTASETFEQVAAYGEINYELTDAVELTVGARWFDEEVTFEDQTLAYGIYNSDVFNYGIPASKDKTQEDDVLFKAGLSWAATDDQLYFFNIAEGFRSGGTNLQASVTAQPDQYRKFESDSLLNYELGAKTTWYDGRLTVNGALFYSDWSDIQSGISVPTVGGTVAQVLIAGGDAEIKGIEVSATALVTDNLSAGLSLTYQEAEFSKVEANSNIVNGSSLPNTPELTATFFAQYTQEMELGEAFIRVDYRYVDEQGTQVRPVDTNEAIFGPYDFDSTILPSYEVTNLTAGLRTDSWYVTGFINNVFDEEYFVEYTISSDTYLGASQIPDIATVGTPRTMGLTVGTYF